MCYSKYSSWMVCFMTTTSSCRLDTVVYLSIARTYITGDHTLRRAKSSHWLFLSCLVMVGAVDSFTVSLHSPNGRRLPAVKAVQGDCQWAWANGGNSHRPRDPIIHRLWGIPQSIFASTNHTTDSTANCRPCFIAPDTPIATKLALWSSLFVLK